MAERKNEPEKETAEAPARAERVEEETYTREELAEAARGFGTTPETMAGALALRDTEYANRRRVRLTRPEAQEALDAFAKRPITD